MARTLATLTVAFTTDDGMSDEEYATVAADIKRYMRNSCWSCRDEIGERQDCDFDFDFEDKDGDDSEAS